MKKVIPFSKEIPFQTNIAEITDIEITHNLEKTPFNSIEGSFLVNGTYKMHEASQIEEKFSYDLPFTIEVDEKYDLSDVKIKISDFFFEIVNDDVLKVNVEVELTEVKERELLPEEDLVIERCYDDEEENNEEENNEDEIYEGEIDEEESLPDIEPIKEKIDIIEPIDILDSALSKPLETKQPSVNELNLSTPVSTNAAPITDIFTSINNDEDTFKAYYVYIVRENDTLDDILKRYEITREEAAEYNNLNEIKIGTKLILPCPSHE